MRGCDVADGIVYTYVFVDVEYFKENAILSNVMCCIKLTLFYKVFGIVFK